LSAGMHSSSTNLSTWRICKQTQNAYEQQESYNVECLSRLLAEEGARDSRDALRGRDVATDGILEEVVRNRHLGSLFPAAMRDDERGSGVSRS
jgi:hypothetical protein